MRDRGADLRLDVVANDRHAGIAELLRPLRVGRDEHGQAVDERAAGVHRGLRIRLVRFFRADRQVRDQDVDLLVAQHLGYIHGLCVGFLDHLTVVFAQTVVRGSAQYFDAQFRHVREFDRVVLRSADRLRQILAHLFGVHVECRDELDVADTVPAEKKDPAGTVRHHGGSSTSAPYRCNAGWEDPDTSQS